MIDDGVYYHIYERPGERDGSVQRARRQDIDKSIRDYSALGVAVGVIADGEEHIKGYGVTGTPPSRRRPMAGRRRYAATSVVIVHHSDERLPGLSRRLAAGESRCDGLSSVKYPWNW